MTLTDIETMPGFDAKVPNGARSVSSGLVFYGRNPGQGGLATVSCREHGAVLCVARHASGAIWRCPTCNEGAFVPAGPARPAPRDPGHVEPSEPWWFVLFVVVPFTGLILLLLLRPPGHP